MKPLWYCENDHMGLISAFYYYIEHIGDSMVISFISCATETIGGFYDDVRLTKYWLMIDQAYE